MVEGGARAAFSLLPYMYVYSRVPVHPAADTTLSARLHDHKAGAVNSLLLWPHICMWKREWFKESSKLGRPHSFKLFKHFFFVIKLKRCASSSDSIARYTA